MQLRRFIFSPQVTDISISIANVATAAVKRLKLLLHCLASVVKTTNVLMPFDSYPDTLYMHHISNPGDYPFYFCFSLTILLHLYY